MAGRGIGVTLGLAAAPILGRLYDPADFGALTVITALVLTLAACNSFCYAMAMPLAESASRLRALFVLSFLLGLVSTAVLAVAVVLGRNVIAMAFDEPELARYITVVPVLFLAAAVLAIVNMALGCRKQFGKVAIRNTVTTVGTQVCQIVAGVAGLAKTAGGPVLGAVGGATLGALVCFRSAARSVLGGPGEPLRFADLKAVAVRYRRFPLIQFWSQLFNALTLGLPVFVLGLLFPMEVVGLYYWARRLVMMPVQMFTTSGSQVYYVDAAQSVAEGNSVASSTSELFRLLVVLTAFPLTAVLLLGPLLFEVVLGESWREAGVYAQILAPWVVISALSHPLSSMLLAKNRLGENFAYSIALCVVRLTTLAAGGLLFHSARIALALLVGGSIIIYCHLLGRTLGLAEVSRRWAAREMVGSYGAAMLALLPAGLLYWLGVSRIWPLLGLAIAGVVHVAVLGHRYGGMIAILKRVR